MLYRLSLDADPSSALDPIAFFGMKKAMRLEKDLEEIIAENLVDVLFEEAPLLPILQERPRQPEADVYALDPHGDLVIFELKRGSAGKDAVLQLLRYSQRAGKWRYKRLDEMYRKYVQQIEGIQGSDSLQKAHKDANNLEEPLQPHEFNRRQHLRVVGNAADGDLVDAIDHWKRQGLSIDFVPYRLYDLGDGDPYFEFFSFPYDKHRNPAERKGVLFDTNASWDKESVWEMLEKGRVAAYGEAKRFADHIQQGDLVFFYHTGKGIIAAGEVKSGLRKSQHREEWYREVQFLTPVPSRDDRIQRYMSAAQVSDLLDKSFFWARTIKVPYLDYEEAQTLLEAVQDRLSES